MMRRIGMVVLIAAVMVITFTGAEVCAKSRGGSGQCTLSGPATRGHAAANSGKQTTQHTVDEKITAGLKRLDTDKDGKLSYEEFMAPHIKRFREDDTNKDGFLTEEEIRNAWKKHMMKGGNR
ncbi:MAG: EF-hand domain-containing protein [Deltaproteobacteria bacterium]|nr:EF-hand domain-containing protein [Deltaproteobacteria bacterium]